ncbi:MAG TPA: VWA domain-containing protein [Anaerolineales bacterium]|nr:VWA domain-containing protein [Anaerolineales bacterium]
MDYSEKPKVSGSAIVVTLAVLLFGCIIVGVLLFPRISQMLQGTTAITPAADATAAPPANSIAIEVSSSNTKEDWMNAVVAQFNSEQQKVASGDSIFVTVKHVTSGGSQQAILNGTSKPVVWSPGDQSWIDEVNTIWRDRNGKLLIPNACEASVLAPIGFAMWRPMAEALGWPDEPISWDDIAALSANAQGWESLGHPEWGQFKFGHTHPDYSNVGLLAMTALTYSTLGKTEGLTPDEVYSEAVVEAFRGVEQNTYHYGIQSRPLMQILAQRGPEYLHAITTSEAETLKTNAEFASSLRYPLVFIFPSKGTFWSEQPYCILDAEWVNADQKEAAEIFRDYLLDRKQQELAITHYLRPVDSSIPLHAPLTLEDGTDPRVTTDTVPALQSPSAEVSSAVKDVFHQTKKKATIVLLLDISGSMEGDKMKSAISSSVTFVERLDPNDEINLMVFGGDGEVYELGGGRAGDIGEELTKTLNGLFANGNTPLYDGVCSAAQKMEALKAEHETNNEKRLYGIVVLSDGQDTSSGNTQNQMFNCLPSGESVEGTKVFTIAFGDDADADLMLRIANRTNGKTFKGDPSSIESIYNAISAEQ